MIRLGSSAAICCALTLASGSLAAQGRHVFEVDSAGSAFNFSGSVTLIGITAPINGTPSNFNVSGNASADVTVSGGAASTVTNGNLVPGNGTVVTVPALSATIPNPVPFTPPLATVNVTSVQAVFRSIAPFTVGAGGAFTTTVVADLLSGSVSVSGAVTATIPLAGQTSSPATVTGTLAAVADGLDLSVPINSTFSFADPGTGATGSLNLTGTVVASDRSLATDVDSISISGGGTQNMRLSAGVSSGGFSYLVLGSASGTAPGFNAGAINIPLNVDGWTIQTASAPNQLPLGNTIGNLDSIGIADASFTFPALPLPILAGLTFDHAFVLLNSGTVVFASNPVSLLIDP